MSRVEKSELFLRVTPSKINKLAALKKAIVEGAYRVNPVEIAGRILQKRLFEVALTLYGQKYHEIRVN